MTGGLNSVRATCIASVVVMAGCQTSNSTLKPGGPAAGNIAWLEWAVLITFLVVSFIMWVLLFWAASRRRGSLETHEPWNAGGGHEWIWVGGFIIPFAVLSAFFILNLVSMRSFPVHDGDSMHHPQIHLIGHQWWWEVRYLNQPADQQFTTANEIHIPVGRPVDIELDTADVIHSFWVPTLHGKVDMIPGQRNYIRIQADSPGVYQGQCAEYCGDQHAHMLLVIIAQPEEDYRAWYAQQVNPSVFPTTAEALHGKDVFMGAACSLCHQIRGTDAHGLVAPDLTHLASRDRIAANSLANNTANLEAWITHAQSLKPGAEMPDVTGFSGTDLRALVAYLQQLK